MTWRHCKFGQGNESMHYDLRESFRGVHPVYCKSLVRPPPPNVEKHKTFPSIGESLSCADTYNGCIYLDYNATTPIYREVAEAMEPFLYNKFGNPSSSHAYGKPCNDAVQLARAQASVPPLCITILTVMLCYCFLCR
jgi:hypothetical protein